MHPYAQTSSLSGDEHALQRVDLGRHGRHIAAVRGDVERGALFLGAGEEHVSFSALVEGTHQHVIGAEAPVFRSAQLLEKLHATATPSLITWKTQSSEDDAIDLFAEQQFGECELWL